jgi:hypothetical protein
MLDQCNSNETSETIAIISFVTNNLSNIAIVVIYSTSACFFYGQYNELVRKSQRIEDNVSRKSIEQTNKNFFLFFTSIISIFIIRQTPYIILDALKITGSKEIMVFDRQSTLVIFEVSVFLPELLLMAFLCLSIYWSVTSMKNF